MLDVMSLRQQFAALHHARDGRPPMFLDGPAGTQVPANVVAAMVHYLSHTNANHGGVFRTSIESDQVLDRAHGAAADLLNAPSAEEVVFGPNMTTLTFQLSRAIGRTLRPHDEVIVTRLDHDANIAPWLLAARDAGATVRWVDIHPEDCTLDMDSLRQQLSERTRLVAVTCASNMVGTVTDVEAVTRLAHAAGARVFLDAVHYAPHRSIDVQTWGCDFLACSGYKFFGPHVGLLWGQRELLEELPAYKVRPAPESLPGRWMTGTQNHEGLAGLAAALDSLADIGRQSAGNAPGSAASPRRRQLQAAFAAIQEHETDLARRLLRGLADLPKVRVWGIADEKKLAQRVPTISITHSRKTPEELARYLASREIYTWNGNMYALALTERLGLERQGGVVRLGLVHYNTADEVDQLLECLREA